MTQVRLRTENGHYLCAEGAGGGQVDATRLVAGQWETFTLGATPVHGISNAYSVMLQASNGKYLSVVQGAGGVVGVPSSLEAASSAPASFIMTASSGLQTGSQVTLKYGQYYITASGGGGGNVTGTLPTIDPTATFTLEVVGQPAYTGGWVLSTKGGGYLAGSGIPADAAARLAEMEKSGYREIFFAPGGGFLVVGADNEYWCDGAFPSDAAHQVGTYSSQGKQVQKVVFGPLGGWIIICDDNVWAHAPGGPPVPPSGSNEPTAQVPADPIPAIVDKVAEMVNNIPGFSLRNVVFAPGGGWAVIGADNHYFLGGTFPQDVATELNSLVHAGFTLEGLVFDLSGAYFVNLDSGYWISSNAFPSDANAAIQEISKGPEGVRNLVFSGTPFTFRMNDYVINNTRSSHQDTNYVRIDLWVAGRSWYYVSAMGNENNGTYIPSYPAVTSVPIGDPSTQVAFSFSILNSSGGISTAESILEAAAKGLISYGIGKLTPLIAAAIDAEVPVLGDVIGAVTGGVLNWLAADVLGAVFQNCDGVVAADASAWTAASVHSGTAGTPLTNTRRYQGKNPGGICRSSDYTVTWSVVRS